MHSDQNLRLIIGFRTCRKDSNDTTYSPNTYRLSSNTEGRARTKSFQDEPFPKDPTRRLQGRKMKERDISDEE